MDYKDIKKDDAKFMTLAEFGAMGRAGCIEIISSTDDKLIYYLGNENIYNGPQIMDMDEFYQVFSEFKNTSCFMEECGSLPKGWEYVSLGMGNNLFVSSEVYDYFKALVNYLPSESHPYQTWMTCALMTLILLDEGFTDKEKFLEKAKEISLEQNSAEIPIIEVWNRYIHYSHKFNEGFKAISLDKIDNPNYIEQKQREIEDRKKQRFYRILAFIIVFIIVLIYLIFLR